MNRRMSVQMKRGRGANWPPNPGGPPFNVPIRRLRECTTIASWHLSLKYRGRHFAPTTSGIIAVAAVPDECQLFRILNLTLWTMLSMNPIFPVHNISHEIPNPRKYSASSYTVHGSDVLNLVQSIWVILAEFWTGNLEDCEADTPYFGLNYSTLPYMLANYKQRIRGLKKIC